LNKYYRQQLIKNNNQIVDIKNIIFSGSPDLISQSVNSSNKQSVLGMNKSYKKRNAKSQFAKLSLNKLKDLYLDVL